jgi:uncharacterized protein (TIGR00725 family)
VGAAQCDATTAGIAHQVGEEIGRQGGVLLCGGRGGVMEAAAEGASRAGGLTVGILPGADAAESPPNPHIQLPLFTGIGQARNLVLVLSAEAVIAVAGGWGTLSEIALAAKHRRPLILLGSWDLTPPAGVDADRIHQVETPSEAVATAIRLAQAGDPKTHDD